MRVRIIMDSGKEYTVASNAKLTDVEQFIWMYFEKNDNLINKLIKIDSEGQQVAINPTHISSIELLNN
jgi:predicted phage-related endonuclease